jgi:hypothetical protein
VEHAALVRAEDLAVVVVGERAEARAFGAADVEEVRVLAAEDLREEDRRVALEQLRAAAVLLEDVVGRAAVEREVLGARVLDDLRAVFSAKPNGSMGRRKIAFTPSAA